MPVSSPPQFGGHRWFLHGLAARVRRALTGWFGSTARMSTSVDYHLRHWAWGVFCRSVACLGLLTLSGCAWWAEYRDSFAYSQGLYRQALEQESNGRRSEAERLLRQSIESSPDDPEPRWELARILLETGQTPAALEELRYLLKAYPDDTRGYITLARTLVARARLDDAALLIDLAIRLDCRSTEALLLRGQIACARGDVPLAEETYHQILLQERENVEARLELARLNLSQGECRSVAAFLRETLAEVPLDQSQAQSANWLLGTAYASDERWGEAASALALGLPNDPSSDQRYKLAYACFRAGNPSRAREEIVRVLRESPQNSAALMMLNELSIDPEGVVSKQPVQQVRFQEFQGLGSAQ